MECEFSKYGCYARLANSDHKDAHGQIAANAHLKLVVSSLDNALSENKSLVQKVESLNQVVRDHESNLTELNTRVSSLQDLIDRLSREVTKIGTSSANGHARVEPSKSPEVATDLSFKNEPKVSSSSSNSTTPRASSRAPEPVVSKPVEKAPPVVERLQAPARVNSTPSLPTGQEGKDIKERPSALASAKSLAASSEISSPSSSAGGLEKGIVWAYDASTEQWCRGIVMFKQEKTAFAEGALRAAYKVEIKEKISTFEGPSDSAILADKSIKSGTVPAEFNKFGEKYVLKLSKKPVPAERYFEDVKMQAMCAEMGSKFNQRGMPKPVQFLPAWVLEIPKNPKDQQFCGLEPFIEGEFIKLNSNYGAVLSDRNTPQAFSHFTWESSNHSLLVVDLQGVKDYYTDPQIHTKDGKGFGLGNLGMNGIDRFLKTHKCNAICQMLALPMINIATDTSKKKAALMKGTMKVPFIEDQLGGAGTNPKWEGPTNFTNGEFQCLQTLSGHTDRVVSLWVNPKHLFSGTADGEIKVWNVGSFTLETTINAHRKSVECMCGNEKYLFSCSTDHSIKVWELSNFELAAPLRDHVGEVYCIIVTDKTLGFLISASFDKTIKVWNLRTMKCQNTLEGHAKAIKALAVSGSILFSGSNDGSIMIWNLKYMSCIFTIDAHEGWVKSLAVRDKCVYSGSFDYLVKEWDITTFNLNATLTEHNDDVLSVWAADKFLVTASNDRSIILWDYNTRKPIATIKGHRSGVQSVVTDGQRLYSGSDDCSVKVWKWVSN